MYSSSLWQASTRAPTTRREYPFFRCSRGVKIPSASQPSGWCRHRGKGDDLSIEEDREYPVRAEIPGCFVIRDPDLVGKGEFNGPELTGFRIEPPVLRRESGTAGSDPRPGTGNTHDSTPSMRYPSEGTQISNRAPLPDVPVSRMVIPVIERISDERKRPCPEPSSRFKKRRSLSVSGTPVPSSSTKITHPSSCT